ncbi:MAG: phosphoribosylformylglycinamidine synthase I [Candidatus Marinimicrobia bacterium]|nr:phosphoribosylformylglycinamidine synthase I [Candidatus Neomarinimicrobiota bacterium]
MKFAVIVFPGSNCDHDAYYALKNQFNINVDFVWHKENQLDGYDGILIPGGFSYGDYLRTGAIARFSPIMKSIIEQSKKGKIILGICNGFQILLESGLLPGSLINNKKMKFLSENVILEAVNNESVFTKKMFKGQELTMPIAHKQGNYIASVDILNRLQDEDRIAFKYKGNNPNGSISNIAGILNSKKNVLGMMPHPERAVENVLGSNDGKYIFESILK